MVVSGRKNLMCVFIQCSFSISTVVVEIYTLYDLIVLPALH